MARSLRSLSTNSAAVPTHRSIFTPHPKKSGCHPPPWQRQPGSACNPPLNLSQKSIAAVTADVAAGPGADLAPGDVAADIVLRAVGVQRGLGTVQHHQQLIFVGMQPYQQAVQGDEARAAEKDAVEPGAQGDRAALAWFALISLQAGIERPDQAADPRLRGPVLVGERVQLVHQPFGMDPA